MSEEKKPAVPFQLSKITTKEFALIEENEHKNLETMFNYDIHFDVVKSKSIIKAVFRYRLFSRELQNTFLLISVQCDFRIDATFFKKLLQENGTIVIPKSLAQHLGVICVGTARGVLHSKTEGTNFNGYLLSTINLTSYIAEDITLELDKKW